MRFFSTPNVLASSIATRGVCSELLESIIPRARSVDMSAGAHELERVLADKFQLPQLVIAGFLGLLKAESRIVASREALSLSTKDAADISILACAIAGEADVFVTGDRELLDLKQAKGLPIVSPRQLWLEFAGLEGRKPGS